MLDAMVKLAKIFCYGSIGIGAVATTAMSKDYMKVMRGILKEETDEETENSEE